MFDALINHKIDTGQYVFDLVVADIEQLNQMAINSVPDITKLSYHSFFKVINHYSLLTSGSALGENCGPLIISKRKIYPDELSSCKIGIPGVNTTANLLLQLLFPNAKNKVEYLFSDIEESVLSDECDVGLVIHETRFTYKNRGLQLVTDLGNLWEQKFELPIPLGGIAIQRDLSDIVKIDINRLLRESIIYAFENPKSSLNFMKQYAFELEEDIIMKHVNLYVNDFSIDIGIQGKDSVRRLFDEYRKLNLLNFKNQDLFVKI
jgi:1,4-dihydroxy-6-naphthoate synthase